MEEHSPKHHAHSSHSHHEDVADKHVGSSAKSSVGLSLGSAMGSTDGIQDAAKERAMSRKSTIALIVAIMVIIGVFAAIVYFSVQLSTPRPVERDYNSYHFTQDGNIWWTQVQKGQTPFSLPFLAPPWELEDIYIPRETLELIWKNQLNKNITVYMTIDINGTGAAVVAGTNIARVIGYKYKIFNMNVVSALNAPSSSGAPVIDCRNSSKMDYVILIAKTDKTQVSAQGPASTCIFIEAKNNTELLRVSDAYTYHLLGIMKN